MEIAPLNAVTFTNTCTHAHNNNNFIDASLKEKKPMIEPATL